VSEKDKPSDRVPSDKEIKEHQAIVRKLDKEREHLKGLLQDLSVENRALQNKLDRLQAEVDETSPEDE